MNFRPIIIIIIILLFFTKADAIELRDSVAIHFRQSKVELDSTYMGNREVLEKIGRRIEACCNPDSTWTLLSVTVEGGASPEGRVAFNEWLSRRRAESIFKRISASFSIPDSITSFMILGRDWQGLLRLAAEDEKLPHRADVITLLNEIIEASSSGEKESTGNLERLKRLHGGVPYLYMYNKIFPALRASKLTLTFGQPIPPRHSPLKPIEAPDVTKLPSLPVAELAVTKPLHCDTSATATRKRPFYMDLRTNLLYDLLAAPTVGAELYLGKNISLAATWTYAWWNSDRRHQYWRIYGGDMALRYWLGNRMKPLSGNHLGLYGALVTYDFEWGGRGYMGGIPGGTLWDKCNQMIGVEYGYSLPVARRINVDFSIAIGYFGGEYITYKPIGGHYVKESTHYRRSFSPLKAEISLVWLLGRGNYNRTARKGGDK